MARRVFTRPLRQGQRRATEWVASADITAIKTLASGSTVNDQNLIEATLLALGLFPSTIVRTRGTFWVQSDQNAANETPFGAFGFAVVSERARAVGVTAIPFPVTDEGSDLFFVHQTFLGGSFGASTGALFANPWHQYDFDSKAMRKLEDGMAIAVQIQNSSGAHGLNYVLKFRMLFKTH